MNIIELRSIFTGDVKLAQMALESLGFVAIAEGDSIDAYWIKFLVPDGWEPKEKQPL